MYERPGLSVCPECGDMLMTHDPSCPLAEPADWRTDPEPESRGRAEDATYADPREQGGEGP